MDIFFSRSTFLSEFLIFCEIFKIGVVDVMILVCEELENVKTKQRHCEIMNKKHFICALQFHVLAQMRVLFIFSYKQKMEGG